MHIDRALTNDAVLVELGHRLERLRLQSNRTQAELAYEAQIGRATLQRLERGESVQSTSLIKVLRALDLLGSLEIAVPSSIELPMAELERAQRHTRRRASGARAARVVLADDTSETPWRWGEEPEASG
jgi:transcriptional regulator with XRE-family HTH domain